MFKWPWKVVKVEYTPSDQRLEDIKNILFPPLRLEEQMDGSKVVKYHIDSSADSNLDAALMDLQEGYNDLATQNTINSVIKKLLAVRKLLEAYAELDKDAKYIIVDNGEKELDIFAEDA